MAKYLRKEKHITIDAIISSAAKRAMDTAIFFAEEFGIKKKNIFEKPELYEASFYDFYNAISGIDDVYENVALFSHNPGITAFSNLITNARINDMPTCAVFALHIKSNTWKDFQTAAKEFWFFEYPKNVHA